MPKSQINTNFLPMETYISLGKILEPTHSLVHAVGPFNLYNMAIEIPNEQISKIIKLMQKSVNARNRFSLHNHTIMAEFEIWDNLKDDLLYFCVELTLHQAIKLYIFKEPTIGYVPVGKPETHVGGQQLFVMDSLLEIINLKQKTDLLL